jgi:predicted dehydrogenase
VQLVGIYEPEGLLVERYAKEFRFSQDLVHQELAKLLDLVKPEAVLAFSSIAEHLSIVEAAAPRGIHVMVEKPWPSGWKTQERSRRSQSGTASMC